MSVGHGSAGCFPPERRNPVLTILFTVAYAGLALVLVVNLLHLRRRPFEHGDVELPSVSVLVPARNEAHNLPALLESLLAQTYPAFDVYVYDDGSEDDTWEVLAEVDDPRLHRERGDGPPAGWVGKVHALFRLTRSANGDLFMFLDADARLENSGALERLVRRFLALPQPSVLTGLPHLTGRGAVLVSLIPYTLLTQLPLPLVPRTRARSMSAINGQFWMIGREIYERYEPHLVHRDEVLEDVNIGRFLKERGVVPYVQDLQSEISVRMYASFGEAWRGFRKNAYLIMGGNPVGFAAFYAAFVALFCVAPFVSPWFLGALVVLKAVSDRWSRFGVGISLLAPVSFILAAVLQLDSAVSHWTGRVRWKERKVGRASRSEPARPPA